MFHDAGRLGNPDVSFFDLHDLGYEKLEKQVGRGRIRVTFLI